MTSKKRKYGDLSARPLPSEDPSLLDDVFAAFTGTRPSDAPPAESSEETLPHVSADEAHSAADTNQIGTAKRTGTTSRIGGTSKTGTTNKSGTTRLTEQSRSETKGAGTVSVAPERDFQRVPNSITRKALADGLFKGKSKHVWDYLWSVSRGAVVPKRTVRRSRPQIKQGSGLGSMNTVDAATEYLQSVGLLTVRTIVGEAGGNEYEVFTPEEVASSLFGLPNTSGTTTLTGNTETTQNLVVPVLPDSGSTNSTLNQSQSDIYGDSKTSFKTKDKINDDEAFADFVSTLNQLTHDLTGKETTKGDAARWRELAEVIAAEARIAAGRTTVSSVPAFLAEHLRRRLFKKDKAQLEAETKNVPTGKSEKGINASRCPDCFGTGMYYPEGFDKGVVRCAHPRLTESAG